LKRPYVLIPKKEVGKNNFETLIYLEQEEITEVFVPTDQPMETRIIEKVLKEVEVARMGEISAFEEIIDVFFDIFQKHFREENMYPYYCAFGVLLTSKTFTELLGYKVVLKKSRSIYHFFTEITDKTGISWIFDPAAEQFKDSFGKLYLASCYDKP